LKSSLVLVLSVAAVLAGGTLLTYHTLTGDG
jgi:hypothetical protein